MPHLSCFFFLSAVTKSCHRAKCQSTAGASLCNSPAPSRCNSPTVVAVQFACFVAVHFACPVAVQFACPVARQFAYCRCRAIRLLRRRAIRLLRRRAIRLPRRRAIRLLSLQCISPAPSPGNSPALSPCNSPTVVAVQFAYDRAGARSGERPVGRSPYQKQTRYFCLQAAQISGLFLIWLNAYAHYSTLILWKLYCFLKRGSIIFII